MIFKNLMVSKLLKSKISNNRVAPYLKHTHKQHIKNKKSVQQFEFYEQLNNAKDNTNVSVVICHIIAFNCL